MTYDGVCYLQLRGENTDHSAPPYPKTPGKRIANQRTHNKRSCAFGIGGLDSAKGFCKNRERENSLKLLHAHWLGLGCVFQHFYRFPFPTCRTVSNRSRIDGKGFAKTFVPIPCFPPIAPAESRKHQSNRMGTDRLLHRQKLNLSKDQRQTRGTSGKTSSGRTSAP